MLVSIKLNFPHQLQVREYWTFVYNYLFNVSELYKYNTDNKFKDSMLPAQLRGKLNLPLRKPKSVWDNASLRGHKVGMTQFPTHSALLDTLERTKRDPLNLKNLKTLNIDCWVKSFKFWVELFEVSSQVVDAWVKSLKSFEVQLFKFWARKRKNSPLGQ